MPGYRNRRFTIYDAMEAKGVFDANPANPYARDPVSNDSLYTGPVPYPKMFYSPTGEYQITVPGEWITTLNGPKLVGEQKELIHTLAKNADEEATLREAGWHDHPAKAITAGGGKAPPTSAGDRIASLEAELARLRAQPPAAAPLPRIVKAATQAPEGV